MSMKYGWFGNQEVPSSSDISEKIANTAMTCYMPYKLRSAASFAAYKREADKFLNKVGDTGVKVLLEIPAAALGNGAFVTSINNAYGNHSKVEGFFLEEPDEFGYNPDDVQDLDLSLTKDLVINLKMRSNQAVYNTWANKCDVLAAPDYVLANGGGLGYGLMALEARTRDYLLAELPGIDDALTRAIGWVSLWESLLEGEVEPEALVDLAQRALLAETDEQNVSRILGYLTTAYWRYLLPERRAQLAPEIESLLWRGTTAAGTRSLAAAWFAAYRNVALSAEAVARLERIWRQEEEVPGVPLAERDFTALAQGLAVRSVPAGAEILVEQLDRIDNPDRRAAFEFVMPALSPDQEVRDAFFDSLRDPVNRAREPWVLRALGLLHHPLRARDSEVYIRPSLDLLEEIQRTGDIFFPLSWLQTALDGHQTAAAAATVEQFLADRPDLGPRLRAKVLQAADSLLRAARIVDSSR